jgi:hypothetical protein
LDFGQIRCHWRPSNNRDAQIRQGLKHAMHRGWLIPAADATEDPPADDTPLEEQRFCLTHDGIFESFKPAE